MKVLAIALAAFAAKSKMPLRPRLAGQFEKNAQPGTLCGCSGRQAGLRRHFAAAAICRLRSFQSVQRAALRRQNVPSISARWSGPPCWREFASAAQLRTVGLVKRVTRLVRLLATHANAVRPNPSLEWTCTGMAVGPRGVVVHHPPRGPTATPAPAPQLKR